MRVLLTILCLLPAFCSVAQDFDYPDYRNKRDNFKKVMQKDVRADLASFALAGIDESISKIDLRKIPLTRYGRNDIVFESGDTSVTIILGNFDKSKHKLQYIEKNLVKIDGKGFYGAYGREPKTSIEKITVVMGKDTIAIPPAAYADIHDLEMGYADANGVLRSTDAVYFSADKRKMYIYLFSQGEKNAFEVTWVIQDRQYLRRVLDFQLPGF
jgi:hypothetical protein